MSGVEIRTVSPIRVAFLRAKLKTFHDQKDSWGELMTFLMSNNLPPRGPTISKYFSMEPIDMAVCSPLNDDDVLPPHERIVVQVLEESQMAVYTHRGAMQDISSAYEVLMPWLETSKYEQAGPSREVYVKVPFGEDIENGDWNNVVVEVHFPIKLKST
ncbi:hypothetical protein THRCLA_08240 [Thraustotheca clavata]|uniref:AraC effector-binding domain-containing protein n=1 Tax=Thraustotheca clavata TaxID=74557 RepID=A0A1V9Z801_9STRA|nr:hypothetical protein THRCLA_08240 [Thraustotheca clavata]